MQAVHNFIDGDLRPARSGREFDVWDPLTTAPESDKTDVDDAIHAAEAAFPAWRDTPAAERARYLNRLTDLIERDLDAFAHAESCEQKIAI